MKELDGGSIEDTTDDFFDDYKDYFDEVYTIGK